MKPFGRYGRLCIEAQAGLINPAHIKNIVSLKLRMILIGAAQQCQAQVEEMDKQGGMEIDSTLDRVEKDLYWTLTNNLRYLYEVVTAYQIKIDNLWTGLSPLKTSEELLRRYYALALMANRLEGKVVNDYGCLLSADPFLEWDVETEHWELSKTHDEIEALREVHEAAYEAIEQEVLEPDDESTVEVIPEETAEENQNESAEH